MKRRRGVRNPGSDALWAGIGAGVGFLALGMWEVNANLFKDKEQQTSLPTLVGLLGGGALVFSQWRGRGVTPSLLRGVGYGAVGTVAALKAGL